MNASRRPENTPATTTPTPEEPHEMPHTDPCATCRIRDQHCCDPWETPQDHEGETE